MWLQRLVKQMPRSRPPPQAHTPAGDITGSISPQKSINMQKQVSSNQNPLLESVYLIRLGVQMTNEMLNSIHLLHPTRAPRAPGPSYPKDSIHSQNRSLKKACSLDIAYSFGSRNSVSLAKVVVITRSVFTNFLTLKQLFFLHL